MKSNTAAANTGTELVNNEWVCSSLHKPLLMVWSHKGTLLTPQDAPVTLRVAVSPGLWHKYTRPPHTASYCALAVCVCLCFLGYILAGAQLLSALCKTIRRCLPPGYIWHSGATLLHSHKQEPSYFTCTANVKEHWFSYVLRISSLHIFLNLSIKVHIDQVATLLIVALSRCLKVKPTVVRFSFPEQTLVIRVVALQFAL